jgi:SAM-dependent methyltransferase
MQNLRTEVERLAPWHFDLQLAEGLRTIDVNAAEGKHMGVVDPNELAKLLRRIYPDGLQGRSFFDVGCNGGGYCIVANQLGAGSAFGFDSRQHWIDQAEFLARHFKVDNVRFERAALHEVNFPHDFDICLFKGILYHLPDPVHALQTVCDRTKELIIVDTETEGKRGDLCFRLNAEGTTSLMTGMHGLAWWPSGPDLIMSILERLGFPETREVFWNPKTIKRRPQAGRCRVIAARNPEILRRYDSNPGAQRLQASADS